MPDEAATMRRCHPRSLPVLALLCALGVAALLQTGTASAAASPATVHLRGTAYEFNKVEKVLAGATIRVAERPELQATVKQDGTYDLTVPDRAKITPYVVAAGYHAVYHQTFTTAGEDLANVNFQTPSDAIYGALVALLNVPVDSAGNPVACAIVSTFSTRNVRDRDYQGFIDYGAHGVAGATAFASPALPTPVYFNAQVLPDPSQAKSSKDGGVIWTGVPAGVYTITAKHPSTSFAGFVATCEPGRVVNANPPWGLHELGRRNPARIRATWSGTTLRSLKASALPGGAVVRISCTGSRCPLTTRTIRVPAGATSIDLARRLPAAARKLRAGQQLDVAVQAHAYDGAVSRWKVRAGAGAPKAAKLCIPLGMELARSCG